MPAQLVRATLSHYTQVLIVVVRCSFGTAATQHYYDITIYLSEADPNFKNTLGKGSGVVASDMVTSDGGKTWTISSITLPQYTA